MRDTTRGPKPGGEEVGSLGGRREVAGRPGREGDPADAGRRGRAFGGGGATGLLRAAARGILARADRLVNRVYGSRVNPLYHSGAIVVALLVALLVTGLYLIFFYRIGSPHASVARITEQVWLGRWIRAFHRYAADAAVVAAAVHAFRLFAQNRSWGPRALAWVSGLLLLFVLFVCGWTGYVMVWDVQAKLLAVEGARFLDALPIFSEPIGRTFVGESELPSAFFFLNLFLHIALPIGMGVLLWIHVSRVARPVLLPPRPLLWGGMGILLLLSVAWPVGMEPAAELLRVGERAALDVFYSFWLPVTRRLPAAAVWAGGGALAAVAFLAPLWARPRPRARPAPSVVDPRLCTGCEQCWLDCPYEAISMVPRTDGRAGLVALVDPARCVSCGICAGSCAPMGVGPPGRTGRDQLAEAREFAARHGLGRGGSAEVVVVACDRGALESPCRLPEVPVLPVACAGSLHTSVIELLIRSGAGGVLVVACPVRDCWNREGPKWLEARMYHDREAELQERVDRRRVRLLHAERGAADRVMEEVRDFGVELARLEISAAEEVIELETECERPMTAEAGG